MEQAAGVEKVNFEYINAIDSCTFRQELDRRKATFNLRFEQNRKYLTKYLIENKKQNAARKQEEVMKDARIIHGLDSIEVQLGSSIDNIAFYDYEFSAVTSGKELKKSVQKAYASITPEGEVLSISTQQKNLHKTTGKVLPGYKDLLHGEKDDE